MGLFVAIPLAVGAMVALIAAAGFLIAPGIVGPVFGFEADSARIMRNVEKIAAEGATDDEIASYAATERVALTKPYGVELKLTNTGPAPSVNRFAKFIKPRRDEAREAAQMSVGITGALLVLAGIWYGLMRSIAWVVTGFMGD